MRTMGLALADGLFLQLPGDGGFTQAAFLLHIATDLSKAIVLMSQRPGRDRTASLAGTHGTAGSRRVGEL